MESELHEKVHADLEERLKRVENAVFPPVQGSPAQHVPPPAGNNSPAPLPSDAALVGGGLMGDDTQGRTGNPPSEPVEEAKAAAEPITEK